MKRTGKWKHYLLSCAILAALACSPVARAETQELPVAESSVNSEVPDLATSESVSADEGNVADSASSGASSDSGNAADSASSGASSDSGNAADSASSGASSDSGNAADSASSGASSDSGNAADSASSGASSDSGNVADSASSGASSDSGNVADSASSGASSDSGNVADSASSGASSDSGESDFSDSSVEESAEELALKARNGWYVAADGKRYFYENGVLKKGWLITGGERYWLEPGTGALFTGGLFSVDGVASYARPDGVVVRGMYQSSTGDTYYANNDGVLHKGWYVGMHKNQLERFYFDPTTYAAKRNLFQVDGQSYYGTPEGFVVRSLSNVNGQSYYANNDGVLHKGWYVGMHKNQLERFYFDPLTFAAKKNLFQVDGQMYYGTPEGYVVRGLTNVNGESYYANNDGVLHKGWYVGMHKNQLERFYFDPATFQAKKRLFSVDGQSYYGTPEGYVVRGLTNVNGESYYANNDGVLHKGWYVGMHKNQLERFYFDPATFQAKKHLFSVDGQSYYGTPEGYVVRGLANVNGESYYANNDGVLHQGWYVGMYQDRLERFYFDPATYQAKKNLFIIDGQKYYGRPEGFVVRAFYTNAQNNSYYGNNDGVLQTWVVTPEISGQLDRFYFDPSTGVLVKGRWFEADSNRYYAQANGACARGWVTIDGTKYQFNEHGVYLGNVQNAQGILGIDVSKHQGPIDWARVKASGVQFAIVRVLGWNKAANNYEIDPTFHTNMQGALGVGIPVGAYLYSYAFNETEMMQEINFVLPALNQWKDKLTYPVYIDYEDPLIWKNTTSNEQRTNILRTGMNALNANGYLSGFYTYYNAAKTYINTQQLIDEGYDFWIAHFNAQSNPWNGAGMWQYTSTGKIDGIKGNVDLNYCYTDYNKLNQVITVHDLNTGKNVQDKMKNLIPQIVQNEVGSGLGLTGLNKLNLFKAQAVAARSYLDFHISRNLLPGVGLRAPSKEVLQASNQVARLGVYYNGSIANTAYGSCAGGYTNTAENMGWGNHYPYLTSVESPHDKNMASQFYPKVNTIGKETMKKNIIKMVGQEQFNRYANNMDQWITAVNKDQYGNITSAVVCGVTITGGKFFENCWGLYSTNLNSWKYNGNGTWTFSTNGNGHGVGMSQYGAAGYIASGKDWRWVLSHYYNGTQIA